MDANTANQEAAKKRRTALISERNAIEKRIQRDTASLAALTAQIDALTPLADAPAQPAQPAS